MSCVGYIREPDGQGLLPAVPAHVQELAIRRTAAARGLTLATLYTDDETDGAFSRLKQDAVHRRFNTLLLHAMPCFGGNVYSAVEFLRDVLLPGGFQVILAAEDLCLEGAEAADYLERERERCRILHSRAARKRRAGPRVPGKRSAQSVPPALEAILGAQMPPCRRVPGRAQLFQRPQVQEQLRRQLYQEARRAAFARHSLPMLTQRRDALLAQYQDRMARIFQEMLETNAVLAAQEPPDAAQLAHMEALEAQMRQCRADREDVITLFSGDNPWIRRFTDPRLAQSLCVPLTGQVCQRWIRAWRIAEAGAVECTFVHAPWRDALGLDWEEA